MKKTIALLAAVLLFAAALAGCSAPAKTASAAATSAAAAVTAATSAATSTEATTASTPSTTTSGEAGVMTSKQVDRYTLSKTAADKCTVYFANGQTDIPFLEMNDIAALLTGMGKQVGDPNMKFSASDDGNGVMTLTRENGIKVEVDFTSKDLRYYDYDKLFNKSFNETSLDILASTGFDTQGQPAYFSREGTSFFERAGAPIDVQLGKHNIPMYYENGKGYLPLQTVSDMFLSQFGADMVFNGTGIFITAGELGDMADIYYSSPKGQRSKALAEFSYNELVLALNMFYSLKDSHNIDDFSTFFELTGLDQDLKSTDPVVADKALDKLCMGYFADMHSGFKSASFYGGKDSVKADLANGSTSVFNYYQVLNAYASIRAQHYKTTGVPASYEEVGDTAYVTFDTFQLYAATSDYYTTKATIDSQDTIGIIQYAHSQIMRKDSPVQNVVLDLSNNTGGAVDAAVYALGWFLGDCTINIENTVTNATCSTQYKVDVNGDRKFDDNDTIASKNLYCLISPVSFSSGNLVPAMFKSSSRVTLLGRKSSGGTGVVMNLSTADGTLLTISGNHRISTVSNGAYLDVDKGVEPDYTISKISDFYDRKSLTKYIDGLY